MGYFVAYLVYYLPSFHMRPAILTNQHQWHSGGESYAQYENVMTRMRAVNAETTTTMTWKLGLTVGVGAKGKIPSVLGVV